VLTFVAADGMLGFAVGPLEESPVAVVMVAYSGTVVVSVAQQSWRMLGPAAAASRISLLASSCCTN